MLSGCKPRVRNVARELHVTSGTMSSENAIICVQGSPGEVYAAIRKLQKSGFDMKRVSIAAREHREEDQILSYYLSGDHMRHWGEQGTLWTAVWGLLSSWGLFVFPVSGPVIVAGPLTEWIIAGLENASILGRFSGIAAGLYSIGIDPKSIPEYEAALNSGKCLVLAHGTREEVSKARAALQLKRSDTGPDFIGERKTTRNPLQDPG